MGEEGGLFRPWIYLVFTADIILFALDDQTEYLCYCDRFSRGSRNMASSSGVKGEDLGKPDMRPLNPSAKDFIISRGEQFKIS